MKTRFSFAKALAIIGFSLFFSPHAFAQAAGGGCTITSCAATNSPSLLTTGTATSLSAGQIIASSSTAGSIVVPSFSIAYANGSAIVPKLILVTNATSGWSAAQTQIDTWSSAPTFTNGDGGTYAVATGSANYLGSYTCTFGGVSGSANLGQAGDGAYAECVPNSGTVNIPKLSNGNLVYWSMLSLSTVTKASGATFTVRPASALN